MEYQLRVVIICYSKKSKKKVNTLNMSLEKFNFNSPKMN